MHPIADGCASAYGRTFRAHLLSDRATVRVRVTNDFGHFEEIEQDLKLHEDTLVGGPMLRSDGVEDRRDRAAIARSILECLAANRG